MIVSFENGENKFEFLHFGEYKFEYLCVFTVNYGF